MLQGWLYNTLIHLFLPLIGFFSWRKCRKAAQKQPGLVNCFAQKMGKLPAHFQSGGILIHAVSLGETRSILPLIAELQQRYPDLTITLSNGSVRGAIQIVDFLPTTVQHCFLPLDYPFALNRFLKQLQPKLVLVIETEIWPNLIQACHQQAIPLILANARLKQSSMQTYHKWGGNWLTNRLNQIALIACQFPIDQQHFEHLGVEPKRLKTLGNLKFDLQKAPGLVVFAEKWLKNNGFYQNQKRFIWVAASTHEKEEALMLQAHGELLSVLPDALLILVPRQADRFGQVAELLKKDAWQFAQRSLPTKITGETQVYLADSVGEMMNWFAVCDVAFIGGSLVPFGGHNILEPAALGKPVISGQYHHNLQALYDAFKAEQAIQIVENPNQLAQILIQFAASPEWTRQQGQIAENAFKKHSGALKSLLKEIDPYLNPIKLRKKPLGVRL